MNLSNKVAVITGGSGGLGRELAFSFLRDKVKVILLYHSNPDKVKDIVQEAESKGGVCRAFSLDVSNPGSVTQAFQEILTTMDRIDILVNGAGVTYNAMSWTLPDVNWISTLNTNLTGAFYCSKAVLPGMRSQKWGRIINLSSVVAHTGVPGTAAYAASKAGLEGMTRCMAVEVVSKGITVNALALGYFEAGIIAQVPEPELTKITQAIPLKRLGLFRNLPRS